MKGRGKKDFDALSELFGRALVQVIGTYRREILPRDPYGCPMEVEDRNGYVDMWRIRSRLLSEFDTYEINKFVHSAGRLCRDIEQTVVLPEYYELSKYEKEKCDSALRIFEDHAIRIAEVAIAGENNPAEMPPEDWQERLDKALKREFG